MIRKAIILLLCFACIHFHPAPAYAQSEPPEPPRVFLDTAYAQAAGIKIIVGAREDFQSALNVGHLGDEIILTAGVTKPGNFTLPAKSGTAPLIIRTSNLDALEEGRRVGPADATNMPKLVSPNSDPVILAAPGAHHYRFVGIEFSSRVDMNNLIALGDGSETDVSRAPSDLTIDRCYAHGLANLKLRRGIALNSARTAIIDSYISEVHEVGADSQAICGWNGPGPFKIVNNYLESAGENVMFGGADPKIQGLVPSDIELRRNKFFKPLSWNPFDKENFQPLSGQAVTWTTNSQPCASEEQGRRLPPRYVAAGGCTARHWSVKNLLELKNAQRVLIEGNLFENNWADAQSGYAILFKSVNQDGAAAWCITQDVDCKNNIVRRSPGGVNVLGFDASQPGQKARRVSVRNNLFDDIAGSFLQISDAPDVSADHNTILHGGNVITAYGPASPGFTYTNNLSRHNAFGVKGDSQGTGLPTLNAYFTGYAFTKNVLAGGNSSLYPPDNYFPASLDSVGFVDAASGNYRLSSSSVYRNAGTDGRDLGADIDAIEAAMRGVVVPPPVPPSVNLTVPPEGIDIEYRDVRTGRVILTVRLRP
ncbi:MAG TPA: hypothetical protein VF747_06415 [Blastocatellia bacterium]|jgi:hypothetical protein